MSASKQRRTLFGVSRDRFPAPAVLALLASFGPTVAAAEPEVKPETPPHKVRITNIGLHIGGGPNDAATKAPFQKALKEVFDDFERCHADADVKNGTFGVDLLVPAAGGHAEATEPRTKMGGERFVACVLSAFESAEFAPSKRGATRFSYSLKFEVED